MHTDSFIATSAQLANKIKVSGVILIDKPQGMTSQQVVSKVKYLFKSPNHNSKKAGHTGTLDPMATGLLPICLGEATKFSHYQLDANKSYIATIQLGIQTDTGDAEGQIVASKDVPVLSNEQISRLIVKFSGKQQQIPPMYSALKKEGKKLYEYARAGIEVERTARPIIIHELNIEQIQTDVLRIEVTCSKGTYIRVLGEDIAKACATLGHLTSLRRISVGEFSIEEAISLEKFETLDLQQRFTHLLPIDACIEDIPQLSLEDDLCDRLLLGQRINVVDKITKSLQQYLLEEYLLQEKAADLKTDPKIENINADLKQLIKGDVRIINSDNQFVGLATLQLTGRLQPKKMIRP